MTFQKEVIEASEQKPVLVDFWAPWCGPCRVLGPVLEQLAAEQSDRWNLVKINTEEHEDLAYQYGIRSIPNVKLFYKGEVIDEFVGALPKTSIERWLDKALPNPAALQLKTILAEEKGLVDPEVRKKLRQFVAEHPELKEGKLHLARHLVWNDPEQATGLLKDFKMSHPEYERVEDIRTIAELLTYESNQAGSEPEILIGKIQQELRKGQIEEAIKGIIQLAGKDKGFQKELPRRAGVALFRLLGTGHELTREYRRRFNMILD